MLRRRGVADGYELKCLACMYGVKIVGGKRVYNEFKAREAPPVLGQDSMVPTDMEKKT